MSVWKTEVAGERGNRYNPVEPHKTIFDSVNAFWYSALDLRDSSIKFSQTGWEFDATEMGTLRASWHETQARAGDILGQKVGDISMCDHWALRVFPVDQRPDKKKIPLQLGRAIEKLVSFYRHVFTSFGSLTQSKCAQHSSHQR